MAKTISTTKANPIRPFYAAVGGVDVAVAFARTGLTDVQTRLAKVEREPKALVGQVQAEAKALPARVEAKINELVAELNGTVDDLNKQYVDLAAPRQEPGRPDPSPAGHPGPEGRDQEDRHQGEDHDDAGQEGHVHREVVRQGHRHRGEEDRHRRQEGHRRRRGQDRHRHRRVNACGRSRPARRTVERRPDQLTLF